MGFRICTFISENISASCVNQAGSIWPYEPHELCNAIHCRIIYLLRFRTRAVQVYRRNYEFADRDHIIPAAICILPLVDEIAYTRTAGRNLASADVDLGEIEFDEVLKLTRRGETGRGVTKRLRD